KRGILSDLVGALPRALVSDLGLIQHQVLELGNRFDHLSACSEMIKLRFRQRHNRAGESVDFLVFDNGTGSKSQSELCIKFITRASATGECFLVRLPPATLH